MQIFIFITCTCCGIISGVVYDVLYVARCLVCGVDKKTYSVKDRIFTIICDLLYCLFLTASYIFISVLFGFGNIRLFMVLGCVLGAILYLKSFHIFVAFSVNMLYNNIKSRKMDKCNDR